MKVCLACGCRFQGKDWHCPSCGHFPEVHHGHVAFAPHLTEEADGFDVEFFPELIEAEVGNFWFECRNRLLVWALDRYFPKASSFLEIGCGTGFVLSGIKQEFPELVLSASDIFSRGLTYAEKRLPGVSLFQMDARCIPFESEFDVIGAFDVLEHIEEDETVLSQMFRATKPGGGIMLTVPQHPFLWSFLDDLSCHKRRYTRPELTERVERAGFEVIYTTSFVFFLLPLLLLSRLKQRRPQDNYDAMAEFKISPLLNVTLGKVLGIEQILIENGFSFPAGGSLLMIAKRCWR